MIQNSDRVITDTFPVKVRDRILDVLYITPREPAAKSLLYITLAAHKEESLLVHPYGLPAEVFLEAGHSVLSFDLPCHGARVNQNGEFIVGYHNSLEAGIDVFEMIVEDAAAIVDECIASGRASAGRIAVGGTSRGGYSALQILASDSRITAGAAFAPVTDWRYVSEFEGLIAGKKLQELNLLSCVKNLSDKTLFMAIGNCDNRVSTASCTDFYTRLIKEREIRVQDPYENIAFYCTEDEGHSNSDKYYIMGANYLIGKLTGTVR